jgi:hypothetical protein
MPALFVVFSNQPGMDALLEKSVKEQFPNNYFEMGRNRWIVAGEGTARAISDKLGITGDNHTIGSSVVFGISGYFGRASSEMWEWIATKLKGADGG